MTNIFFTSDTHFGHTNVIKYCSRPFSSIEEMDESIIQHWNDVVKRGDVIYHLGDFALVKSEQINKYVKRLNGQKFLVYGNHDRWIKNYKNDGFVKITPYLELKSDYVHKIILMHYAMKTWNGSHYGNWQLHGHSHGSMPRDYTSHQLDVGVDVWNFRPVSIDVIAKEMEKVVFKPVDKHN
jgi:calcineurin-like phosphoesterase family protein